MPRSITIPDVDDTTAIWLLEEAGRRGISMETVAGLLLQRGLEWERRRTALPAYHDIDALVGSWREDEAAAFLQAVADPAALLGVNRIVLGALSNPDATVVTPYGACRSNAAAAGSPICSSKAARCWRSPVS